jgi:hypothetical protein
MIFNGFCTSWCEGDYLTANHGYGRSLGPKREPVIIVRKMVHLRDALAGDSR